MAADSESYDAQFAKACDLESLPRDAQAQRTPEGEGGDRVRVLAGLHLIAPSLPFGRVQTSRLAELRSFNRTMPSPADG
ncbi:hypothetical protein [Engelhardtia mirabilis]|uniref:Uncharacterized protein n=1 Tax=Engelhardtia mirabilis TaxID=2528011 RepID=A0A518BDY5_9BACT|nr:hypothetical protein Pla133_01560 [Planctomycetes bacterium Pla133]QDU99419.1 hypothetical protein Pla86_01560 [Planctomycetes bacterium Pla86]